jgi:hypothetical protein
MDHVHPWRRHCACLGQQEWNLCFRCSVDPHGDSISRCFTFVSDLFLETPSQADCPKRMAIRPLAKFGCGKTVDSFLPRREGRYPYLSFARKSKVARSLFPEVRCEFVPFGINTDEIPALKKEMAHRPVRILSVGNDPHRDWANLIHTMKSLPDCYLKIATIKVEEKEIATCPNIELLNISSNDQ